MARTNSPSRIGVDPAAAAIGGVRRQPVLLNLLLSLRPAQWVAIACVVIASAGATRTQREPRSQD